jgi:N-acetyl sugar amidotransferase
MRFNTEGVCGYCLYYKRLTADHDFNNGAGGKEKINEIVTRIKNSGKGRRYDCIVGLSGGVDSTYLAYQVSKFGLRPLAVHLDNGWNSEISVKNVENIVGRLKFDLYTHVINWEEFKNLQLAYLRASVIDIEAITDHAVSAILYRMAAHNKVRYIISGANMATEAILPQHWYFNKNDHKNIEAINKEYGAVPLKTFPLFDYKLKFYCSYVLKIKSVGLLDYVAYDKSEAKKIITQKLGWHDYGGKHYESIFTRFYQGYILPRKFGIDKRKAHLSNLICSGQITRDQALEEFKKPAYDTEQLKIDYVFVLKKLGLSGDEFERIMDMPIRKHAEFSVEKPLHEHLFFRAIRSLRDLAKINKG